MYCATAGFVRGLLTKTPSYVRNGLDVLGMLQAMPADRLRRPRGPFRTLFARLKSPVSSPPLTEEPTLPERLLDEVCTEAVGEGVVSALHPNDFVFEYIKRGLGNPEAAAKEYFIDGCDSAQKVLEICRTYLHSDDLRVLEFAAGYGRVSRFSANLRPS